MQPSHIAILGSFDKSLLNFPGHLIGEMRKRGHRVSAFAPEISPEVSTRLLELGIKAYSIPMARAGMNPVEDFRTFFFLEKIFTRLSPDFLLSYTMKPVIYGSLAAKFAGVPGIFSIVTGLGYNFYQPGFKGMVMRNAARALYRIAISVNRRVFFQNPDNRKAFLEMGILPNPSKAVLVNGSGIDVERFSQKPLPTEPSFLLIARLLVDKGIREYVSAARLVKNSFPQARFRLAGGLDPNPSGIKASEVEAWNREGIIEYLGELEDVRPALSDCLIYVLPSYHEGLPRTVLEAMAAGRPIITTHAPGCRETVVEGANGFLIPVKDSKLLAQRMETLLRQPELVASMARESRRMAVGRFDVRNVTSTILGTMGL